MNKSLDLLVAKIRAEKLLVVLPENDPFRSAYEDFLAGVDFWINHYEKLESLELS
jgi:hypothetical protein